MSQDVKKKYSAKRKKLFFGVILTMLIYLLISFIPTIFGSSKKTILPEEGILYNKTLGQGIVIKNETVYKAEGSGKINLLVKEGDRVGVGIEVANMSLLKDTSDLKQELIEIDKRIETLSKSDSKQVVGESNLDSLKTNLLEEIQSNISIGNFIDIHEDKEELQIYDSYSFPKDTLLNQSIATLNEQKKTLEKQINSSNLRYFSIESGIVSYEIDGLENLYSPKEFENYTYDKLDILELKESSKGYDEISIGNPIFKIINNFEWYMAIKIEDKANIEDYEIGQAMVIELDDETVLKGEIIKINVTGNSAVVVLKLNTYLHNAYNLRYATVNIVNSKKEGFKIPTNVIIERDGKKGVYIKEINGIVKFRQVNILGEEGDYTYIDKGDSNGYLRFENQDRVKTVTLFNEIFLDTTSVTEGEILK